MISDLKQSIENGSKEVEALVAELAETKQRSIEEKEDLRRRITDKENKVSELTEELRKRKRSMDTTVLSGIAGATTSSPSTLSTLGLNPWTAQKTCRLCGNPYEYNYLINTAVLDDGRCPDCKKKDPFSFGS